MFIEGPMVRSRGGAVVRCECGHQLMKLPAGTTPCRADEPGVHTWQLACTKCSKVNTITYRFVA